MKYKKDTMGYHAMIQQEFQTAQDTLNSFMFQQDNLKKIQEAAYCITNSMNHGGKVLSCGNGGSMCDAMHFAEELTGRFRENRTPLPAIAISDAGYISCVSNDYGHESIFSRYIEALGKPGDVLLAISSSGNSKNVIQGMQSAMNKKMEIISLTGNGGGIISSLSTIAIDVPFNGYADRIQEIHVKIIHVLILLIEKMNKSLKI